MNPDPSHGSKSQAPGLQARGEKLQKVLARLGLGSRRELERWIAEGRVSVDGVPAHLGMRVSTASRIAVDGQPIPSPGELPVVRVLVYHKPVGQVSTRSDPQGRPTVFDALPPRQGRPWLAIGRLDMTTSGLLLLTNDGGLAARLMHPRYGVEREYAVRVLGAVSQETLTRLEEGVPLEDGWARFETVGDLGGRGANHWYRVTLREGRRREVCRLWESQGIRVSRLMRIRFGNIVLPSDLQPGEWRELQPVEVAKLAQEVAHIPRKPEGRVSTAFWNAPLQARAIRTSKRS
jgi:23S rRNA pseudouridine2605 synthase